MSKDKYVAEKLIIPSDKELFQSNINTHGLDRFIDKMEAKNR